MDNELGPEEFTLAELAEMKAAASGEYRRSPMALMDGVAIDREFAEDGVCPKCGGKTEYDCVLDGDSYRSFAVCAKCEIAFEF
jgi:hypothetical protein